MDNSIVLHCGAWEATPEQVEAVPVPNATATYQPVGHMDLLENLRRSARLFGLEEESHQLALNREGQQLFAILNYRSEGDIGLSVAARNSYDQSLSVGIAAGSRVFICDNLALSGEWAKTHKHTVNAWKNLYAFLYGSFPQILTQHKTFIEAADRWKSRQISQDFADHIIVEAARMGALPATDILPTLREYAEPTIGAWSEEPKSVWRLYNAATQICKKYSPILQLDRTRKLSKVFQTV